MIRKYLWNIMIAIDQFCNALLLGDPDETISGRCGKLARSGRNGFAKAIDFILGRGHCAESIEEDEGGDAVI